jgi:ABC-type uncharacterized transport system permease subunit
MRRVAGERASLFGQVVVYAVLLLAYGVLFRGISPEALARYSTDRVQLTWYLVLTQAQVACCYMHYREMEYIVRSGGIEAMLLRPVPFGRLVLAQWFGQYTMRLIMVLPAGCLGAWLISGGLPPHPLRLALLVVPSVAMGGLIFLCIHFGVGCSTAWSDPCEPVFRLFQKALYLIGARSWPLLLYPMAAQAFAWATPFPAVMAVPGNLATSTGDGSMLMEIAGQIAWVCACLAATGWMGRALTRRIMAAG